MTLGKEVFTFGRTVLRCLRPTLTQQHAILLHLKIHEIFIQVVDQSLLPTTEGSL